MDGDQPKNNDPPPVKPIMESVMEEMTQVNPQDDQAMGNVFGNMFRQMRQLTTDPPEGGLNMETLFATMFGPEVSAQLLLQATVKVFFEENLKTHTLNETIRLTKAEFNLPDDYELEVKMTIKFPGEVKTAVPEID